MAKSRVKREPVVQPQDQSIRHIPLTRGKIAIVDAADFVGLNQHNWYAMQQGNGRFYAVRKTTGPAGSRRPPIWMHREVLGLSQDDKRIVDHIVPEETLDNRHANLRAATHSQNHANALRRRGNTSGFKGVTWDKRKRKWFARITVMGKPRFRGYFESAQLAHDAYCELAKEAFGEFAHSGS